MKVSIQYDPYLPLLQKRLGLQLQDCDGYVTGGIQIDRTKREGFRLVVTENYKRSNGTWNELASKLFVDPPDVSVINETMLDLHDFQAETSVVNLFDKLGITPEQARQHGSYFRLSLSADAEINYVPSVRLRRFFPVENFLDYDYLYDYKERHVRIPTMNQSIGRFLRKLFPDAPDTKIEELVDITKAHQLEYKLNLYEVSDEKILWAYLEDNYDYTFDLGTLKNSCMRFEHYQDRIKFFVDEPKVSLLIATRNVGGVEKLVGRVLIWTLDDGTRAMEYEYAGGAVRNMFDDYAEKNNIKACGFLEKQTTGITLSVTPDIYPSLDSLRIESRGNKAVLVGYYY